MESVADGSAVEPSRLAAGARPGRLTSAVIMTAARPTDNAATCAGAGRVRPRTEANQGSAPGKRLRLSRWRTACRVTLALKSSMGESTPSEIEKRPPLRWDSGELI